MSNVVSEPVAAPGFSVIDEIAGERRAVSGMAISADGAVLMLTHYGDDSFSLIDTASGAVALIVIDVYESCAVAMSGSRAYVSSVAAEHDSVLIFDTDSNEIVAEYPVEFGVTDLAVSPNGRYIYAGRTGADGADVAILDTATGKQESVSIAATTVGCVRVSPDGRRLYVAANGASTAQFVTIDIQRNRVDGTVEIGSPIRDIALSPNGATAYVASCGPDFCTVLDIVDTRASTINATYKIGAVAGAVAKLTVSRNGEKAYLVGDQHVTVLSTTTLDVLGCITVGDRPSCVVESPDGTRLYVADYAGTITELEIAAAPADALTSDDELTTARHAWAFSDLLMLEPTLA